MHFLAAGGGAVVRVEIPKEMRINKIMKREIFLTINKSEYKFSS
jgi:hypothetical protein